MSKKKDPNIYPPGLSASKVRDIIDFYDRQTDEEAAEEILSAAPAESTVWVQVPLELLPRVRKLLARNRKSA